jgi:hypothetical protein
MSVQETTIRPGRIHMISRFIRILNAVLILAVLQACSLMPTGLPGGKDTAVPATATATPFVAEIAGPPEFSATLAAPDIVSLTWKAAPDAVGYKLQILPGGLDPLTIAYLPKTATHFEHALAPESSTLTYRLQTITATGPAGASSLQIATQGHTPNPLTTQAVFSTTEVASAMIGPAGGTIETTDARGVVYTLVIPPQALNTDLKITMTPVSKVGGWPLDGGLLGAVRLEPEGWLLNEVAYLTIRLPAAHPSKLATVGFAFNGSGEEFHLAPATTGTSPLARLGSSGGRMDSPTLRQDAGTFNMPVIQLRTSGIGGSSAASAEAQAANHAPTSSSDAADQKAAAAAAAEDDLAPLFTDAQYAEVITGDLLTQIHFNVKDCYDFKRAAGAFQAWEAKTANLEDGGYSSSAREAIINELAQKAVETIEKAGEECRGAEPGVVPASIPCAEKLTKDIQSAHTTPGSNPLYSELSDAIGKDTDLQDRFTAADPSHMASKCPHSFGVNTGGSLGYRWTSSCIPSLDRPYQLTFKGSNSIGEWRMFPSSPFGGKVEGQTVSDVGGTTMTDVFNGTYKITVLKKDVRGYPLTMDADLTLPDTTTTYCTGGVCTSFTHDATDTIPLIVNSQRCPLP